MRLLLRAVDAVVKIKNIDPTLKVLPDKLKSDILRVATLRGHSANLCCLLHPKVRCLDLNNCQVTEEQLYELCICNQLRSLQINPAFLEHYQHSSQALDNLFHHLPKLIKLHIQRNDGLTDSVISSLVRHCPSLLELDIGGCKNFTDEAIETIAKLKKLISFCLSGTKVSDIGLIALSNGCCKSTLTELKLINCIEVSDVGINAVFQNLKKLTVLDFCGCPKITSSCQVLRDHIPLKNLTYTVYWN